MPLQFIRRISLGDAALETGIRDLQTATLPGGPVLLVSTGPGGGLSSLALTAGTAPRLIDSLLFPDRVAPLVPGTLEVLSLNGTRLVAAGGNGSDGLLSYTLTDDGQLGAETRTTGLIGGASKLTALASTGSVLITADPATGGLTPHRTGNALSSGGTVTQSGVAEIETTRVGGQDLALTAATGVQGVTSYKISPSSGALSKADSLGAIDGLGVRSPTALEVIGAHGATWVILAAAGSGSLSVMKLAADGGLRATDHVLDTLHTRFGGVQALKVLQVEGHVFVIAGGADDGLSLFTLLPTGQLVHLQSLAHSARTGLQDITDIEARLLGDAIQIYVASETPGLSLFKLSIAGLGDVLRDTSGTATRLTGTPDDDQLIGAGTGRDTLLGGNGDDILVASPGGTEMTGGAGSDIFVIRPGGHKQVITDFRAGVDQLDLSALPMLRSPGQLSVTPTSSGVKLSYGTELIVLHSHDGKPLSAQAVFGGGFDWPDRALVLATTAPSYPTAPSPPTRAHPVNARTGSDGDDLLMGSSGRDDIRTGLGNDTVWAQANDDIVYAGAGHDRMGGAGGDDRLWAGAGRDTIYGGAGADRGVGGAGRDTLWGGAGNDTLDGQGDADRLGGGAGRDLLRGGAKGDEMFGGTHNDTLSGDTGADTLWGVSGDDRLFGGPGTDRLGGGDGGDLLMGGSGSDTLQGGRDDDRLTGGGGADTFVFARRHGTDVITDFTPGSDHIRLEGTGRSFARLELSATPDGTLIDYGSGTILLENIAPRALDAGDFILV